MGYLRRKTVSHRQYVDVVSWNHLVSKKPLVIIWLIRILSGPSPINELFWDVSCQGWSTGGEEQLCETRTQTNRHYIFSYIDESLDLQTSD